MASATACRTSRRVAVLIHARPGRLGPGRMGSVGEPSRIEKVPVGSFNDGRERERGATICVHAAPRTPRSHDYRTVWSKRGSRAFFFAHSRFAHTLCKRQRLPRAPLNHRECTHTSSCASAGRSERCLAHQPNPPPRRGASAQHHGTIKHRIMMAHRHTETLWHRIPRFL